MERSYPDVPEIIKLVKEHEKKKATKFYTIVNLHQENACNYNVATSIWERKQTPT